MFGSLVKQWKKKQTAAKADWLIGPDIMGPGTTRIAADVQGRAGLRERPAPWHRPAAQAPQEQVHRRPEDSGGVHINSGIPNHAFFLVATALGGNAWEKAGRIWYEHAAGAERQERLRGNGADLRRKSSKPLRCRRTRKWTTRAAWKAVGL